MKKNIISILVIFILVCIGSYLIYSFTTNDYVDDGGVTVSFDVEVNLLEKMGIEEYQVDTFLFKNVKVYLSDGKDSFEAIFVGEVERDVVDFEFVIYDENGKILDTIVYELKDVEAYEERNLFCFVQNDLTGVSYFEVNIKND